MARAAWTFFVVLTWTLLGSHVARGLEDPANAARSAPASIAPAEDQAPASDAARGPEAGAVSGSSRTPWTSPKMAEDLRRDLAGAVELAVRKLREEAPCRRLFEELGAEGEVVLARTLYYAAPVDQEKGFCRRASAATMVGARQTWVCRSFRRLAPNRAAAIVLHEALHHSGMSERPLDRHALDSLEINRLVEESCNL